MLGADKNIGEWLFGVQFFQSDLMGDRMAPVGGRKNRIVTLLATKSYFQDRLFLKGFIARDSTHKGSWLNARLSWQTDFDVILAVQLDRYTGSDDSVFGRLTDESRIKFTIEWAL